MLSEQQLPLPKTRGIVLYSLVVLTCVGLLLASVVWVVHGGQREDQQPLPTTSESISAPQAKLQHEMANGVSASAAVVEAVAPRPRIAQEFGIAHTTGTTPLPQEEIAHAREESKPDEADRIVEKKTGYAALPDNTHGNPHPDGAGFDPFLRKKHTATTDQVIIAQHIVASYAHLSETELLDLVEQRLQKYAKYLEIPSIDAYIKKYGPPEGTDLNMFVQKERDQVQYRHVHIPKCGGSSFCAASNPGLARAALAIGLPKLRTPFQTVTRAEFDQRCREVMAKTSNKHVERDEMHKVQDVVVTCGSHNSFALLQHVNHPPQKNNIWNITGTLKHLSMSTVLRGSVSRYLSYWYYSPTFHNHYRSPYCEDPGPGEERLCPEDFEKETMFLTNCNMMTHLMAPTGSNDPVLQMKNAMLNLMKVDVFAFLEDNDIRAELYTHVYGGSKRYYVFSEDNEEVIVNANPRKGRNPGEYETWQLARLSYLQRYEAGFVDFAKHLLVHRWHSLLTLFQMKDILSIDEEWVTPEGQVYWLR